MVVNQMTRRGYYYRTQTSSNTHGRLYIMIPSESRIKLR